MWTARDIYVLGIDQCDGVADGNPAGHGTAWPYWVMFARLGWWS